MSSIEHLSGLMLKRFEQIVTALEGLELEEIEEYEEDRGLLPIFDIGITHSCLEGDGIDIDGEFDLGDDEVKFYMEDYLTPSLDDISGSCDGGASEEEQAAEDSYVMNCVLHYMRKAARTLKLDPDKVVKVDYHKIILRVNYPKYYFKVVVRPLKELITIKLNKRHKLVKSNEVKHVTCKKRLHEDSRPYRQDSRR